MDWLSLAMDDGSNEKNDGTTQNISDITEVDEMNEMDDADFLAHFNKRWNSTSNPTELIKGNENDAPHRDTDSPATAVSDHSRKLRLTPRT